MANKPIGELIEATSIGATDLFVLKQSGGTRKLAGQTLLNWLTKAADGHGGIQSITELSSSGLTDIYRITLADTTTVDFTVTNGKGISKIAKTGSAGLVDTYTITYSDNSTSTFTVTNGAKGDKGDNTYVHIKYAAQQPTAASHSIGDIPDNWMGVYYGALEAAPSDWQRYQWFQIKGERGATGTPASVTSATVTYQVSTSGTVPPDGVWSAEVPTVPQGRFLWTRTVVQFNSGDPVTSYSVTRMGMDGSGTVSTVNGNDADSDGNVIVSAADVGALPVAGGTMSGNIAMGGNRVTGLNTPTDDGDAATKSYVDTTKNDAVAAAKTYTDGRRFTATATLLATGWGNSGDGYGYTLTITGIKSTDYPHITPIYAGVSDIPLSKQQMDAWANVSAAAAGDGKIWFTAYEEKPAVDIKIQIEVMR